MRTDSSRYRRHDCQNTTMFTYVFTITFLLQRCHVHMTTYKYVVRIYPTHTYLVIIHNCDRFILLYRTLLSLIYRNVEYYDFCDVCESRPYYHIQRIVDREGPLRIIILYSLKKMAYTWVPDIILLVSLCCVVVLMVSQGSHKITCIYVDDV